VTHKKKNSKDEIGQTMATVLSCLRELGYHVDWEIINSLHLGLPQSRKRVYIVGKLNEPVEISEIKRVPEVSLENVMERGRVVMDTPLSRLLLSKYSVDFLQGKSIKDKRGGANNIHSWSIGIKGEVTVRQSQLLNTLLKERRKKHWAKEIGITWMDGMPLTLKQIATFAAYLELGDLKEDLDALVRQGYLRFDHPKELVGDRIRKRVQVVTLPKGYTISTGKLSFGITKILDPKSYCPTLVATDMNKLAVVDMTGLRKLTEREGLRCFGFPEEYSFPDELKESMKYDLLGNTVAIPCIKHVSKCIL